MKAVIRRLRRFVIRRLRRFEERFGPAAEREFSRRLRERLEAGRRRVTEAYGEPIPAEVQQRERLPGGRQILAFK
jgi:hypothetical protein